MNQDELPLGHRIAPEMLAHVEDTARRIPEGERDDFFRQVADRLRPICDLRDSDVRHACGAALARYAKRRPTE